MMNINYIMISIKFLTLIIKCLLTFVNIYIYCKHKVDNNCIARIIIIELILKGIGVKFMNRIKEFNKFKKIAKVLDVILKIGY